MFVGITRAREVLQLSLATNREFRGQRRRSVPSQFLMELPRGEMEVLGPPSVARREWEDEAYASDDDHVHPLPPDELPWEADAPDSFAPPPATAAAKTARPLDVGPLATAAELERAETVEAPRAFARVVRAGHGRTASRVRAR